MAYWSLTKAESFFWLTKKGAMKLRSLRCTGKLRLVRSKFNIKTDHTTEAGSSALPATPAPLTAATTTSNNTDEASHTTDSLYEDTTSRPESPSLEVVVFSMNAFDGERED